MHYLIRFWWHFTLHLQDMNNMAYHVHGNFFIAWTISLHHCFVTNLTLLGTILHFITFPLFPCWTVQILGHQIVFYINSLSHWPSCSRWWVNHNFTFLIESVFHQCQCKFLLKFQLWILRSTSCKGTTDTIIHFWQT